jgi:hypothetical protein
MPYELEIHFTGTAPGIQEHRLSLSAFGEPLNLLLGALKRIATQIVRNAVGGEYPKVGRYADLARNLDIEIVKVDGHSLGLSSVISFREIPGPQPDLPLWAALPERAGKELLEAIERESSGELAHVAVHKYLSSLPEGIEQQKYNLHSNGRSIRKVEFGRAKLTEIPLELPFLRRIEGDIVGVGFDPGKNEVRVKPEDGNFSSFSSDPGQVDAALDMRKNKVRTIAVQTSKGLRLISLKRAAEPVSKFDPESATNHVFSRWDGVLKKLAR